MGLGVAAHLGFHLRGRELARSAAGAPRSAAAPRCQKFFLLFLHQLSPIDGHWSKYTSFCNRFLKTSVYTFCNFGADFSEIIVISCNLSTTPMKNPEILRKRPRELSEQLPKVDKICLHPRKIDSVPLR